MCNAMVRGLNESLEYEAKWEFVRAGKKPGTIITSGMFPKLKNLQYGRYVHKTGNPIGIWDTDYNSGNAEFWTPVRINNTNTDVRINDIVARLRSGWGYENFYKAMNGLDNTWGTKLDPNLGEYGYNFVLVSNSSYIMERYYTNARNISAIANNNSYWAFELTREVVANYTTTILNPFANAVTAANSVATINTILTNANYTKYSLTEKASSITALCNNIINTTKTVLNGSTNTNISANISSLKGMLNTAKGSNIFKDDSYNVITKCTTPLNTAYNALNSLVATDITELSKAIQTTGAALKTQMDTAEFQAAVRKWRTVQATLNGIAAVS